MRKDRLDEEALLVNGPAGGEVLSKEERQVLKGETEERKQAMEQAKKEPIRE